MFLTMNEYLLGAQKILNLYGYNCHKNDEDAISFVASCMMKADQTWDGKSSSRDTWRFNQARYAIMKLKTKHQKRKKLTSLDRVIGKKEGRHLKLSDIIVHQEKPDITNSLKDVIDKAKNVLSAVQFKCVNMYYIQQKTMEEIGSELGITKQAVSLSIKRAIQILQDECRNKVDYIAT